jgi:thymidylate synthase (FAD)
LLVHHNLWPRGGAAVLTEKNAQWFREQLALAYTNQEALYQTALAIGVPKERARVHLPVGRYSKMRATANLRNWLGFLQLRSTEKNPAAQWEIRQYADAIVFMLGELFPRTVALFTWGQ